MGGCRLAKFLWRFVLSGNPKDSPWRSTSASKRHRKPVCMTLSDAARVKLDRLAKARGPGVRSQIVEEMIMKAPEPGTDGSV